VEAHIQQYKDFLLDPSSPRYNPDMPYFTVLATKVSEVSDKLIDLHVPFMPIHETKTPQLAPGQFSRGSKTLLSILQARLDLLGVEILKEVDVKRLITEEGNVTGFYAEGADGSKYTMKAKAVLLASGSFVMNRDLMKEYNPDDMKFYIAGPKWATGDGMLMAKEVGAGYDCMECGVTSHYTAARSLAEISFIHYIASPGVVVNGYGNRFVSESIEYKVALKSFKEQDSTDFYWIFDERGRQNFHPNGNSYRLDYRFLMETGDVVEADNIEDLQEKTGLSGLVETIAKVNDCAVNGVEDEFGNTKLAKILSSGKMYALKVIPSPYIAQGGVKIDPQTHVQREDGSIIEGLYAAGDVTGSAECRDSAIYRIGLAQALAYGYAAYETILQEI